MSNKQPQRQIKQQSTGKLFTAIIEKQKFTIVSPDDKFKTLIKKEIAAYNIKNSDTRLEKIKKLLTPIETKKSAELVVQKKVLKNEKKSVEKSAKAASKSTKQLEEVLGSIKTLSNTVKTTFASLDERLTALEEVKQQVKAPEVKTQHAPVHRGGEY